MNVIVADVWYTVSDETYYVCNPPGRYQEQYGGGRIAEVIARAEADGWQSAGYVGRHDFEHVRMWSRGAGPFGPLEWIALWDETEQPMKTAPAR